MTSTLRGSDRPLHEAFDAGLVDLDGVTYRGPEPIPGAPGALAAARATGMRLVFVTNNASRGPSEVATHLSGVGIATTEAEVMTSAQVAAELLAARVPAGAAVLVVGGPGLRALVEGKGFRVVDSARDLPAAVIQGFHPDVGWKHLAEAAYAIENGAWYLVTNRDLTLPNERGLAPGNGSLIQAVVTASGVEPSCAGKPEPDIFRLAAERVGSRTPLVIGDRLDTDIRGANAAGYASLLVLTGVSSARDAILAVPDERPSFIGDSVLAVGEAHPIPRERDGWWHVGEARARVLDGKLVVEGAGIDAVRASCAATWAASDMGDVPHIESSPGAGLE